MDWGAEESLCPWCICLVQLKCYRGVDPKPRSMRLGNLVWCSPLLLVSHQVFVKTVWYARYHFKKEEIAFLRPAAGLIRPRVMKSCMNDLTCSAN